DFFHHFYVPNNASLAIVGDIDIARTKAMVEKYFGTIPRGPDVTRRIVPAPPLTTEQRVRMTDAVELPQVTMAWLTSPIFLPGNYDAIVTKRLLDGTRASRLTRRLVHDLQIAQKVEADVESLADTSVFTITATAKPGHSLAELETAIDAVLADLARRGPTRSEVEAAETALIAGSVADLDDLGNFGGFADQLNYYNHYLGDPDYINEDLRRTAEVTPERVQRFVADQLDPGRRVVVEVTPGPRTPVDDPPAPPETNNPGSGPPPASAEPWRNTVPTPGPPPATPLPNVERFTLANGLPVWLVESHRLPLVGASLVSRLGSGADPPERFGLAALTTGTLDGGTTSRDALGMSRELGRPAPRCPTTRARTARGCRPRPSPTTPPPPSTSCPTPCRTRRSRPTRWTGSAAPTWSPCSRAGTTPTRWPRGRSSAPATPPPTRPRARRTGCGP